MCFLPFSVYYPFATPRYLSILRHIIYLHPLLTFFDLIPIGSVAIATSKRLAPNSISFGLNLKYQTPLLKRRGRIKWPAEVLRTFSWVIILFRRLNRVPIERGAIATGKRLMAALGGK